MSILKSIAAFFEDAPAPEAPRAKGEIPKPEYKEFEARLPGQAIMNVGRLEIGSTTWAFIRHWAEDELKKVREKNDSVGKDIVQTSYLRGEIKILKDLLTLPNPRTVKGLLEEEE